MSIGITSSNVGYSRSLADARYLKLSGGIISGAITSSRGTTGVGTVSIIADALTTVTGVGTDFLSRFKVGDSITVTTTSTSETKVISAIASNTSLTTAAFVGTAAAVGYTHTTASAVMNPNGSISASGKTTSDTMTINKVAGGIAYANIFEVRNGNSLLFAVRDDGNYSFPTSGQGGTLAGGTVAAKQNSFRTTSVGVFGFTSSSTDSYNISLDTAISRKTGTAGTILIGNGAANNASGSLELTNLSASGTVTSPTYQVGNNIITEATTARTLALTDSGKYIRLTSGAATVITIPAEAAVNFPIGSEVYFRVAAASTTVSLSNAGVVVNGNSAASITVNGNFALKKVAADTWDFI